jgi:hypothetical protein
MKLALALFTLAILAACGARLAIQQQHPAYFYVWPPEDSPPILDTLKTPFDVASYLDTIPYADDYDTRRYLPPGELVTQRRGDCTAFARFWLAAIRHQGGEAYFVAEWYPAGAHAFCVFKKPPWSWRVASNNMLYVNYDMGNTWQEAALQGAALLHADWQLVRVMDASGTIRLTQERIAP